MKEVRFEPVIEKGGKRRIFDQRIKFLRDVNCC